MTVSVEQAKEKGAKSRAALGLGRLPQVVIDSRNQLVHSHRLGEMGISTGAQSLRSVFDTAPG